MTPPLREDSHPSVPQSDNALVVSDIVQGMQELGICLPPEMLGAARSARRERRLVWQDSSRFIDQVAALSGLEFLKAGLDGEIPLPPMMVFMRMKLREAAYGEVVIESTPSEEHYTVLPIVHGGYAATLLDSAMWAAALSTLPAGQACATSTLELKMLRPITESTGKVLARGRLIDQGRRQATAEASLVADSTGKVLATGTTTCLLGT